MKRYIPTRERTTSLNWTEACVKFTNTTMENWIIDKYLCKRLRTPRYPPYVATLLLLFWQNVIMHSSNNLCTYDLDMQLPFPVNTPVTRSNYRSGKYTLQTACCCLLHLIELDKLLAIIDGIRSLIQLSADDIFSCCSILCISRVAARHFDVHLGMINHPFRVNYLKKT